MRGEQPATAALGARAARRLWRSAASCCCADGGGIWITTCFRIKQNGTVYLLGVYGVRFSELERGFQYVAAVKMIKIEFSRINNHILCRRHTKREQSELSHLTHHLVRFNFFRDLIENEYVCKRLRNKIKSTVTLGLLCAMTLWGGS